jgi:hypothetical protein
VVAGIGVGFVALGRTFQATPVPADRRSTPSSVPATTSPTSARGGTDLGLGYPLCNVSTITADLDGNGTADTAYLGTRPPEGGNCLTVTHGPTAQGTSNTFLAIDVTGDGRADDVQGPLHCQQRCSFLAAPDLVGDARHELAVAYDRGFFVYLYLFVVNDGSHPILAPINERASLRRQTGFVIGGSPQSNAGMYCSSGHVVIWSAGETTEGKALTT